MIQVIGFLFCVYLIFKGVEIFQIALSSSRDDRGTALTVGALALIGSLVVAALFAWWLVEEGQRMQNIQNQMPRLP